MTREPKQARAQAKVELILEATLRILDAEGMAALSTNRIAETAGVSIGTLYQYFAGKEEVLQTLIRREVGKVADRIEQTLRSSANDPSAQPGERVRFVVRALLNGLGGRHRVRKMLLEAGLTLGGTAGATPVMAPGVERIAHLLSSASLQDADGRPLRLTPIDAFILTHAVTRVIQDAAMHDPAWLAKPEMEDGVVRLILGFLGQQTPGRPRG